MAKKITIEEARERVAKLAEAYDPYDTAQFVRELRAGAWDDRADVQAALRGEKLKGED